jgi:hypothetical protein
LRVAFEERQRIAGHRKQAVLEFFGPPFLHKFAGFIETLQGQQHVAEIAVVRGTFRRHLVRLAQYFRRILVLPQRSINVAQVVVCATAPGIVCNLLAVGLRRLVQFSGDPAVVFGFDQQALALAGVLAQLECFLKYSAARPVSASLL